MRVLVPALAPILLAACGLTDFLGESDEGPPLPGERISILTVDRGVRPDPELVDVEVKLPRPYRNTDWSQPGGTATHAMYHLELRDTPSVAWTADVGDGSDSSSEQFMALVGYRTDSDWTFFGGYRYLNLEYDEDGDSGLGIDIDYKGPVFGASLRL